MNTGRRNEIAQELIEWFQEKKIEPLDAIEVMSLAILGTSAEFNEKRLPSIEERSFSLKMLKGWEDKGNEI